MSTWKLYQKILPIFSFQHIDSQTLDDNILYSYKELFSKYLKQKTLIPSENLMEIGFNEFVNDPVHTLENLYAQFQLPPFEKAKPYFEKYAYKHRNYKTAEYHFKDSMKKRVYKHWKIMFDTYDYNQ
jgi:hypothetical protein